MPCLRQVSATFAPASTSFRIRTIYSSLNFDFFMQSSFGRNSTSNWIESTRTLHLSGEDRTSIVLGYPSKGAAIRTDARLACRLLRITFPWSRRLVVEEARVNDRDTHNRAFFE
jgi:hypothetical protein